jgi:hypothetical protein
MQMISSNLSLNMRLGAFLYFKVCEFRNYIYVIWFDIKEKPTSGDHVWIKKNYKFGNDYWNKKKVIWLFRWSHLFNIRMLKIWKGKKKLKNW